MTTSPRLQDRIPVPASTVIVARVRDGGKGGVAGATLVLTLADACQCPTHTLLMSWAPPRAADLMWAMVGVARPVQPFPSQDFHLLEQRTFARHVGRCAIGGLIRMAQGDRRLMTASGHGGGSSNLRLFRSHTGLPPRRTRPKHTTRRRLYET